jgi:cyclophilin family peptidyl-prolyl cis-trans isomerase/HEAT repeat protein
LRRAGWLVIAGLLGLLAGGGAGAVEAASRDSPISMAEAVPPPALPDIAASRSERAQATALQVHDLPLGLPENLAAAATLLAAEDRRELGDDLLRLTHDQDPAVRARAALAVGRVALPAGAARLMELMRDPDPRVRALAAFAAGLVELDLEPATAAAMRRRLVEQLLPLLDDPETLVVEQAVWALGILADPAAIPGLRELLTAAGRPPEVLAAALGAWWRLPGASIEPLVPLLASPFPEVRRAAATALRRLGGPGSTAPLETLLADPDPRVRAAALAGLREAPLAVARRHLPRLFADDDATIVHGALQWVIALWSDRHDAIDEELLLAVLRASLHRDRHVQRLAFRALALAAGEYTVPEDRLVHALQNPDAAIRMAALDALAVAGGDLLDDALDDLLREYRIDAPPVEPGPSALPARLADNPLEAAAVVRALAVSRDRDAWPWLRILADYGPEAARAEALRQLTEVDPQAAAATIERLLEDGSPALQAVAAEELARLRARGLAPSPGAGSESWTDLLWDAQRRLAEAGALEPRLVLLRTLMTLDRQAIRLRASILLSGDDRVVRLWALRNLAPDPPGPSPSPLLEAIAPLRSGRDAADYRRLAGAALAGQARPPRLEVATARGTFVWELRPDWAPLAAAALLDRVDAGFFEGAVFHRVIADFVIQAGDPTAIGFGGAPGSVRSEETPIPFEAGVVGLALAGRDTGGSQFFVTVSPQPHLTGVYPALGRIVDGDGVLERIQPGDALSIRRRD